MKLKDIYQKEVSKKFIQEYGYKNIHQIPKIIKVSVNIGVGKNSAGNPKYTKSIASELANITGQKPTIRKAKKAISGFKLKIGQEVGVAVTLRGKKMYDFLDRIINLVLPRIRDFRGLSNNAFDKNGNYTISFKEQYTFPEINYDQIEYMHGLQVTIVTTAKNQDEGKKLLQALHLPLEKKEK
ncbi:MAG: 50S ribosomal protein L5 [Patescibacteria group bacterium]|nr:50S ribosomal protein L5 [Patescibacteria group bacterium]